MTDQHSTAELVAMTDQSLAHNYAPLEVMLERGDGSWVWDVEGTKYLDLLSAYSALNLGHKHPQIIARAHQQLDILTLTSRAFYAKEAALLARELVEFCQLDQVLFMTSGAEAVETAIKASRKWAYERKGVPQDQAEIVVFSRNFHGRTTTIVGFSDSSESRAGFGPFTPGFVICPYDDLECLEAFITPNTAAVLIEPIQGEGGIVIPAKGYLQGVAALCASTNVLLVIDEIQTGLGRTGARFAFQHESGVKPDLLIIGKSLGGGVVPISAVVGTRAVMEVFTPGTHGSTFGGNPFACAIAREVLGILQDGALDERSQRLGDWFVRELRELQSQQGAPTKIKEVRGQGLLIGIEFHRASGTAKAFAKKLLERRILTKDTRTQTLRIAPPLNIDEGDLKWALGEIREVLR